MEKSNYKEWSVDFNGKIIKVSNWWNLEGKCSADLYLDNEHLDQNTEMFVNPNKVMLSKSEVSDDIKSIEVFSAGFFSVKLSNDDVASSNKRIGAFFNIALAIAIR